MYDSPHRILKTLSEIIEHTSGDRRGAICREITKIYEEFNRGTLKDLFEIYANRDSIKGEFVLIIEGKNNPNYEIIYSFIIRIQSIIHLNLKSYTKCKFSVIIYPI